MSEPIQVTLAMLPAVADALDKLKTALAGYRPEQNEAIKQARKEYLDTLGNPSPPGPSFTEDVPVEIAKGLFNLHPLVNRGGMRYHSLPSEEAFIKSVAMMPIEHHLEVRQAAEALRWVLNNEIPGEQEQDSGDGNNYRPASEFLEMEGELGTLKGVRAFAKRNKVRSKKPSINRLLLHAGDMMAAKARERKSKYDPLDSPSEVVEAALMVEGEKEKILRSKRRK